MSNEKDAEGVVRLSLHFNCYNGMREWLRDVAQFGAFGMVPNGTVSTVMEPRRDFGVRKFDSHDAGKTSLHYTLDNSIECGGKSIMEEDVDEPPLFV